MTPPRLCNVERVFRPCRAIKIIPSTRGFYSISSEDFELATLPVASRLSVNNIDTLPYTSFFRLLTIVLA
jgi:hypothetical protein